MLSCLLSALIEVLFGLILRLLCLPVILVLATPLILVCAAFGPGPYAHQVVRGYGYAVDFWGRLLVV